MTVNVDVDGIFRSSDMLNLLNDVRKNSRIRSDSLQRILRNSQAIYANWTNILMTWTYQDGAYFWPKNTNYTTTNTETLESDGFFDFSVFDTLVRPDKTDKDGEHPITLFAFGYDTSVRYTINGVAYEVTMGGTPELVVVEDTMVSGAVHFVELAGKTHNELGRTYFGGIFSGHLSSADMP